MAAAVAIALLGNTLSQFSRSQPSTGHSSRSSGAEFSHPTNRNTAREAEREAGKESPDPRAGVGRAVFSSIALVAVVYVFLSYATVVGFDDSAGRLAAASVPMVDAAQGVASFLAFLAYLAGFTSICSSLIWAANSQARIIFSSGREGLLPSVTVRVTDKGRTPWVAFLVYLGLALGLTYVFGWSTEPVVFFGEIATLGTILIALGVLVAALAYAAIVYGRDRTLGERVGSIVADAD